MKRVYLFIVLSLLILAPMLGYPGESKPEDSIIQITAGPVVEDRELYYLNKSRSSRTRPLPIKEPAKTVKAVKKPKRIKRDRWAALAMCESTLNPRAVNSTGKYRGAFQFDLTTWHGDPVNMPGDPIDYSYEAQKAAAQRLYTERGASPWPTCGKHL